MRRRPHRAVVGAALAVVAALAALGVSGCVLDDGTGRTPEEARAAFVEVLDSTQAALGGSWQVSDDPTPRGCMIPLWVEGVRFPGLRLGPVPDDTADALSTVAELWSELGFSVEENLVGDVVELKAGETEFDSLIFRVSTSGMTLQGESECRPAS